MIRFHQKGKLEKTYKFLDRASRNDFYSRLQPYAEEGVRALASATPVDTGKTAASWDYEIKRTRDSITIHWTNSNVVGSFPVAIALQYGHGKKGGGYVAGRNYINPAIQPIFDRIADEVWKEVTRA